MKELLKTKRPVALSYLLDAVSGKMEMVADAEPATEEQKRTILDYVSESKWALEMIKTLDCQTADALCKVIDNRNRKGLCTYTQVFEIYKADLTKGHLTGADRDAVKESALANFTELNTKTIGELNDMIAERWTEIDGIKQAQKIAKDKEKAAHKEQQREQQKAKQAKAKADVRRVSRVSNRNDNNDDMYKALAQLFLNERYGRRY